MKTPLHLASIFVMMAAPALSAHANPWATATDVVLSKFHDVNQARSADTPGEDEMLGRMVRSANGKTGTTPGGTSRSNAAAGSTGAESRGAGGASGRGGAGRGRN